MPALIDMLHAVSRIHPEQVAISASGRQLTYAGLWQATCSLGRRIEMAGGGDRPVAVLLPPGSTYVAAIFACLAAGRISLLLDASYPIERNATLAAECGCRLVLAPEGIAADLPGVASLSVGDVFCTADALSSAGARPSLSCDDPAFILATSGSTGRPKAIVHSQRTMYHWARTIHHAMHIGSDDRVLSLSSFSTLGGLTGVLGYPLAGACIEILDVKAAGLSGLIATLAAQPVTILRAAPSMLRGLARLPEAASIFSDLRVLQTYGEPLTRADASDLRQVVPAGCFLRSTYGATECSGLSWFVGDDDGYDPVRVPAGTLMPDTEAALIDEQGRSVQPGEPGELVIRSRYNALGEWIDGGMVAGRLTPDPDDSQTRQYRTGDLARMHPDGTFVVLGRKDRMVKINGQRIEPAEIEAALREAPGVMRAEVVVDAAMTPARLLAFVVLGAGFAAASHAAAIQLMERLKQRIPGHMLPAQIVPVHTIPLLPGGKVDQAALLEIAAAGRRQPRNG